MKVILLENKIYELSLEGNRELCYTEHGRKVTKQMLISFSLVKWVVQTLEDCVLLKANGEFIRTSNSGNSAFIAQRSS